MNKDDFEFWCPLGEVNKAVDKTTGEEIMLLGGIASTADEDSDGEFLDPKGFDIKPLLKSGLVNWHHQAKTNPGTIVGEPTRAEIRKDGLYIETQLYPHSQVACDIWELAKTLAADSKTRRLGYSIEGRVIQRKSEDPTNPDYKKIVKAIITGVAITHQPKNPKTFANIIKGDIDDDLEDAEDENVDVEEQDKKSEEKAIDTETAAALKKESVDDDLKITTFGKSEVFDKLFIDIPGISIVKAKKIYQLIENIASMKKNSKAITQEDIEKAYNTLGIEMPEFDIEKGETDDDEDSDEEDAEEIDDSEKDESEDTTDDEDVDETDEDEDSEDEDSDDEDSEDEDGVEKADYDSFNRNFERIEKAISISHNSQSKYVKALGVMVKAQSIQLEKAQNSLNLAIETIDRQNEIIKSYESRLDSIDCQIAEFGSGVPAPKSVRNARPVERAFGKANDDEFNKADNLNQNRVSIKDRAVVAEILDQATFAKGYDEEFSKACTAYEAGADLPNSIIARIKNEFNIEIVK